MQDAVISGFFGEYRWLSNFWIAPVSYDGTIFNSAEHAYVYAKCEVKPEYREIFINSTPGEIKRWGRKWPLRKHFEEHKLVIMYDVLIAKFEDPELQAKLLGTYPATLVETNNWGDTFWGQDTDGRGYNHLGKLLEKVRDYYAEN